MWNIISEVAKKQWRRKGKDPYVEWDKFQGKEKTRKINRFKQGTIKQSLKNLPNLEEYIR